MARRKLLIDTDPGTDDLIALLMALRAPELEVLGVTTVGGNASLDDTTRNALRILECAGRTDVLVAAGAAHPLWASFVYAYDFHGPGGLTVKLPDPNSHAAPGSAHTFIYQALKASPGEVTLLALGPLTNVALLFREHPDAKRLLKELVVMGGAVGVPGNITAHAEFNVYNDPLAAQAVFASGAPTTLVDLRVCRQVALTRADIPRLEAGGDAAKLVARVLDGWFQLHPTRDAYELCDPLAMAALLDPTLVDTEAAEVAVDTSAAPTRGMTYGVRTQGPVKVTRTVDAERTRRMVMERLGTG